TLYGIDFVERRKLWEKNLLAADQQRVDSSGPQPLMFRLDGEGGLYLVVSSQGAQQQLGQIGALTESYLCLRTPEGLVALDPLRGTVLWKKTDVSPRTQIFGDDEYLYLAEARDKGVGTTRAVRGSDGATMDGPDFSSIFQRRPRIVGGRLLVSETSASGATALHLYDVRSGKDAWRKDLAPGSLILRVEDPDLAATLTQEGRLTVTDLRSRRDLLDLMIKREHMEKVSEGLVLRDSDQYYLAL